MGSQIYSNIIQVFTLFMKAIFSQVRHPSHPGRGHASPTCHMTQFEQSDWLRSENFVNIMIEYCSIAHNIEQSCSYLVQLLTFVGAWTLLIMDVYFLGSCSTLKIMHTHSTTHDIHQILFILDVAINLCKNMITVDIGISLHILLDYLALWYYMNTPWLVLEFWSITALQSTILCVSCPNLVQLMMLVGASTLLMMM